MADDAFLNGSPDDLYYGSNRDFKVLSFHRALGGMVKKIIGGFFNGIRGTIRSFLNLIIRMLQSMERTVAVEEPEPKPEPPTMSSIYDSISSVMSDTKDPEPVPDGRKQQTSETKGKTPPAPTVTKTAPLRNKKNLPKASSSRGPLGKKSIMEDLAKGGSSPDFDSGDSAVALSTETNAVVQASYLAGLLPTLVAGLVFSTAGTIVGYLWNTEWTEKAYDYYEYYWGDGDGYGDGKVEADPFYDVPTSSSTATGTTVSSGHDDMSVTGENHDDVHSSAAVPVTPDKF